MIGKTTTSALQSGLVYGFAGQVDAIVDRIRDELGAPDAPAIATGGLAELIAPHSQTITAGRPGADAPGAAARLGAKPRPAPAAAATQAERAQPASSSAPRERVATAQGLENFAGISTETAGARGICLHLITLPPGGARTHTCTSDHETALYIVSGHVGMWFGPELEQYLEVQPGDFLYIPADMPHQPFNLSDTEGASARRRRTDPNEQESVVLLRARARARSRSRWRAHS